MSQFVRYINIEEKLEQFINWPKSQSFEEFQLKIVFSNLVTFFEKQTISVNYCIIRRIIGMDLYPPDDALIGRNTTRVRAPPQNDIYYISPIINHIDVMNSSTISIKDDKLFSVQFKMQLILPL